MAILAVHGVADQQPGDSIRQVSNILLDFNAGYEAPLEHKLRIPLEPVLPHEAEPPRGLFEKFAESSDYVRAGRQEGKQDEDPSLQFMFEQLRFYDPQKREAAFETSRLETSVGTTDVHIYEGYWADLSRLGRGLTTFLTEAYQLLLHLPSLGRTAVDFAGIVSGWAPPWRFYSFMQRWSVRLLTLFIAAWSLDLASFILPALVAFLAASVTILAAKAVVVLAAVALIGLALREIPEIPTWLWAAFPVAFAAAAVVLVRPFGIEFAVGVAWLVSAAGIAIVLKYFDRARPGAFAVGMIGLAVGFGALIWSLSETSPSQAVLWSFQIVNYGLTVTWAVHFAWLIATMAAGWLCTWMSQGAARVRARRTAWTAGMTLSLSTLLFANLNLAGWSSLLMILSRFFPDRDFHPLPMLGKACMFDTSELKFKDFATQMLECNASTAFVTITAVFALFCAIFVWSIFPSVIAEVRQPARTATDERPAALGRWLSRGLNAISFGGNLLVLGVAVVFVVGAIQTFTGRVVLTLFGIRDPLTAVRAAGSLLIVLISARFWLAGASSALDVMLDVDNYMREHPRTSTPRAAIAERITSLLRFLAGENYNEVIIIAHSQGSVIIADLLRFLAVYDRPLLDRFEGKLRFFTMGCPLRQLYSRAFPGLYPWMEGAELAPDPKDLHLVEWVNDYRSGDYVGRWLWRGEADPDVWRRDATWTRGSREETCIGEGAHTHYWDWAGGEIGARLGALIAKE